MKKIAIQVFATATAIAAVLVLSVSVCAQNSSETVYKAKCAACHAPDGSGSPAGKKLGAHDFRSADVQTQTDAALTGVIANGKNKMPGYQKTLKADEITALVAYIRTLASGK